MREHYCFIEVDAAIRDAALEVLDGSKLAERNIAATISNRSGG